MSELGAIFYRGPSLLTGDPIIGVLTGLEGGSNNPKTGPMVQAWMLRVDTAPMDAVRQNLDDAICGECQLRGRDGRDRRCYTVPWLGANNVYKRSVAGDYLDATWRELQALVEGRQLRLCAYGDPGAAPFDLWRMLLVTAAGWTAYTHQWRTCDPRFQTIAMASVDTIAEFQEAQRAGWRTFRVRANSAEHILPDEVICPASEEAGHRTTCARCELCRGTSRPARPIVIAAHGNNGSMTAFYRSRQAAEALTP